MTSPSPSRTEGGQGPLTRPGNGASLRLRLAAFALLAVLVLGSSVWLLQRSLSGLWLKPVASEIQVRADMGGFSPRTVRVRAGQPFLLTLINLDGPIHLDSGGEHQLAIDELGVNLIAPARGRVSVRLQVDEPGRYPFYCDVCCGGRESPSMQGRLIVEE